MLFTKHTRKALCSMITVGMLSVAGVTMSHAAATTVTVQAGPIWNQQDANGKCRNLAKSVKGVWTGHWWTTVQGKMSVCQIKIGGTTRAVQAGPIWSQQDAKVKCPKLARSVKGTWTGAWWTTVQGKMSVCNILF